MWLVTTVFSEPDVSFICRFALTNECIPAHLRSLRKQGDGLLLAVAQEASAESIYWAPSMMESRDSDCSEYPLAIT